MNCSDFPNVGPTSTHGEETICTKFWLLACGHHILESSSFHHCSQTKRNQMDGPCECNKGESLPSFQLLKDLEVFFLYTYSLEQAFPLHFNTCICPMIECLTITAQILKYPYLKNQTYDILCTNACMHVFSQVLSYGNT